MPLTAGKFVKLGAPQALVNKIGDCFTEKKLKDLKELIGQVATGAITDPLEKLQHFCEKLELGDLMKSFLHPAVRAKLILLGMPADIADKVAAALNPEKLTAVRDLILQLITEGPVSIIEFIKTLFAKLGLDDDPLKALCSRHFSIVNAYNLKACFFVNV